MNKSWPEGTGKPVKWLSASHSLDKLWREAFYSFFLKNKTSSCFECYGLNSGFCAYQATTLSHNFSFIFSSNCFINCCSWLYGRVIHSPTVCNEKISQLAYTPPNTFIMSYVLRTFKVYLALWKYIVCYYCYSSTTIP